MKDQDNAQRQTETEGSAQEENRDRESRCGRQPRDLGLRGIQKRTLLRRKREVERVTAALDKNLVQWMDQQIEKGTYRSRTHCIEDCIRAKKNVTDPQNEFGGRSV